MHPQSTSLYHQPYELTQPICEMKTAALVQSYFRVKAQQIKALGALPICEHSGLKGSHREELHRIYLREILPRRYEVGRGMVYGPYSRSREADVVIWDSLDFPSLPMTDHAFYFAESVRCVVECKSTFSSEELKDVLGKCDAVAGLFHPWAPGLKDELAHIKQELVSLRSGVAHHGALLVQRRIASAAIFLAGGESIDTSTANEFSLSIQEAWPDIMVFLGPGIVISKDFATSGGMGGTGTLSFYAAGDDALLLFTHGLLARIADRTELVQSPLNLIEYAKAALSIRTIGELEFPLTAPVPQRTPIWADGK